MDNFQERHVSKGYWLYDNLIKKGVIIKAINYDYWYELEKSDGLDMASEVPELNEAGEMYMIHWTDCEFKSQESFTVGTLDLPSTKATAEAAVKQPIEWV